MVALLGIRRNRKISLEVLNLAMVDQRIMKSSRCISSSSSPSTPKFSYVLENANKLLKKLDHRDWLAPNEVLKIFKSLRDPESVITVFEKLSNRKDYKPNEPLYSVMIQKLAHARKFDAIEGLFARIKTENCRLSDEFFYRIIKIYGNVVNNPEQAIKILFRMPDFRCWPSVKTFNFVLNMLVCAKQFDVIHEVYLGAPRLGVTIDACCFNILIKALCQLDKLDAAFALLHEFPKQNCRPNTKTYSTLMHGLCKNDRVNEAFELFDRMEKEDCYPDTITFNILISGLCKQGRVDEAMDLLHQMKLKGCSPNSGSYQAVLYGLLGCEKFVEAKDFIDRMHSEDLALKQMVHQGFVPRMGTWKKILGSMSLRNDSCLHIAY
eukprot:TRINITY_DN34362_c2_g1_i2.p1 TRINITY_DN34362_c2_g1~~TRINITY_DN34362_c2_g1_i2.p1  ORF type:complete len:379 (+),score=63.40 TRINITY_DN34362_c2_g1_i2:210-1346(+)